MSDEIEVIVTPDAAPAEPAPVVVVATPPQDAPGEGLALMALIETLQTSHAELKAAHEALKAAHESLQGEVAGMHGRINDAHGRMDILEAEEIEEESPEETPEEIAIVAESLPAMDEPVKRKRFFI